MRPELAMTKPSQITWKHIIHQRFDAHVEHAKHGIMALTHATLNPVCQPEQGILHVHMLAFEQHRRPLMGKMRVRPVQLWGVEVLLKDQTPCFALIHVQAKRTRLARTNELFRGQVHSPITHVLTQQDSLVRCTHQDVRAKRLVEVTAMEPCFINPQPRGVPPVPWRSLAGDLYTLTHEPWARWEVQSHRHDQAWPPLLKPYQDALCSDQPRCTHLFEGSNVLLAPHRARP